MTTREAIASSLTSMGSLMLLIVLLFRSELPTVLVEGLHICALVTLFTALAMWTVIRSRHHTTSARRH